MSDIRGVVHSGSGQSRSARDAFRAPALTPDGSLFSSDYLHMLSREGRIFCSRDADEDDTIAGQTSFAATTPTLLLAVPDEYIAIPLWVRLVQTGSVAGGAISIHVTADNTNRFSSGGTTQTVKSLRTDNPVATGCTLYSAPTAAAATASVVIVDHDIIAADVAPASADAQRFDYLWTPGKNGGAPIYVVGAGCFMVFTYAASTGPTWLWSIGWAEIPESELN